MTNLPEFVIKALLRLANFPYGQVCKHHAGLIFLEEFERFFPQVSESPNYRQLVRALIDSDDEKIVLAAKR